MVSETIPQSFILLAKVKQTSHYDLIIADNNDSKNEITKIIDIKVSIKECILIFSIDNQLSQASDSLVEADGSETDLPTSSTLDLEERWVTCPVCDSAALDHCVPQHCRASMSEPWASCHHCNHKFKVG